MKQILALLVFAAFLMGCKKSSGPQQPEEEILESGTWRVTQLVVDGVTKTDLLIGYIFTFQPIGMVKAVKNNISENGTWSLTTAGSGFARYSQLIINFPTGGVCYNLTQDWDLGGASLTTI